MPYRAPPRSALALKELGYQESSEKGLVLAAQALETLRQPQIILPTLNTMIGGTLNIKHVHAHWDEIYGWQRRSSRVR